MYIYERNYEKYELTDSYNFLKNNYLHRLFYEFNRST